MDDWKFAFSFRNTLIISLANALTSIFAGFVIFAYLGYLSYITGQNVSDVVSEGKIRRTRSFIRFPIHAIRPWPGFCRLSVCGHHVTSSTTVVDSILFHAHSAWTGFDGTKCVDFPLHLTFSAFDLVCQCRNHRRGHHRSSSRITPLQHSGDLSCLYHNVWTWFTSMHGCKNTASARLTLHAATILGWNLLDHLSGSIYWFFSSVYHRFSGMYRYRLHLW